MKEGLAIFSVLASLAPDAESSERVSAWLGLDHRSSPGKDQDTAGSPMRSQPLDLASQQASTTGGKAIVSGNRGVVGKRNKYWVPRK